MKKKILLAIYYLLVARLPNSRYLALANRIRMFYLSRILKIVAAHPESRIQENVYIADGEHLTIGRHCQINENVFIQGATIGDYVMIGADTAIVNVKHNTASTEIPMIKQGRQRYINPVIEDDVWIGRGVIILPGVRIARGTIIGAGAVVTRDTEEYSIYGGVPARLIRSRRPGGKTPA